METANNRITTRLPARAILFFENLFLKSVFMVKTFRTP
jgi:hypothetical protein